MTKMPIRLGLQQRVLPAYRAAFFDLLAAQCGHGLSVFAGDPRMSEAVGATAVLENALHIQASNRHLLNGRFYFCWQSNFISWLDHWQPDVLIVEANPRYLSTPSAVRWMRRRKRPVLAWGLGAPGSVKRGGIVKGAFHLWRQSFFNQFDALIAYSRQGAREYAALGFSEERIFTATNAVAPRPTGDLPTRRGAFDDKGPVVLYVGRLTARKRIELLLRACASINSSPKPIVWIVGDGPERERLQNIASETYPDTHFWGALHGEALSERYQAADLFVLPGTGGLAVQQAMSHGLPVIVAEADGTQADLVNKTNGWLVQAGRQDLLASAIEDALGDVESLRAKGQCAYQITKEKVNIENMVAVFSQAIMSVLE
jgi:glycosyltransferase involved in cell wall biosynthesis